jgi:hypothetical protein
MPSCGPLGAGAAGLLTTASAAALPLLAVAVVDPEQPPSDALVMPKSPATRTAPANDLIPIAI